MYRESSVSRRIVLDTGVVVALVNGLDPDHDRCVEVWSELRASVSTVEGVLVEAAHLLGRVPGGARAAVGLVLDVGATIMPPTDERLRRAVALMEKYADTPMDFVDALLVATAEEQRVDEVLTLDRRGFETYRIAGRKRFRISP